jgi:long-chain acyl-CoA synthetase
MVENAVEKTLSAVLAETVARVPDARALLSDERCLTWAELSDEAGRVAALLLSIGIRSGDVIGFAIDKKPEVVVGFLAAARIGAIMAPINFKLHHDRIEDQFRTSNITAILTQADRRGMMASIAAVLPEPARRIYVGAPGPEGTTHYDAHRDLSPIGEQPGITPDTPCYYNYTSGTTGRPKGAVTTHRHILVNAVATIEGLGFTESDIFLGMFSVFAHPHELFHRSIVVGGAFAILDSISPRRIAEAVASFKVTWMMAVPSFYEMMLDYAAPRDGREADLTGRHDLSSLRILESGGAYVGAETMERMEALFGATFLPVWGCTEATGVGIANGPGAWRKPGATGRPVPGYEVRAVDDAGNDVAPGSIGELLLRGPALAAGYVNQPEETAEAFIDGWYHTSDLIIIDEDGFIQFAGRRSEMLKIGGIRVYPLEIETALKSHPEVRDVVVVRAEERLRGEIARAVVQVEPGSRLTVRDVQAWCRQHLASYKVPRIVEFWAEIPKLPNGKIDKRAVTDVAPDAARDER